MFCFPESKLNLPSPILSVCLRRASRQKFPLYCLGKIPFPELSWGRGGGGNEKLGGRYCSNKVHKSRQRRDDSNMKLRR